MDPAIFTYGDAVDHLITVCGAGAQSAEQRDIRQACQRAYDDVIGVSQEWEWLFKLYRIPLVAKVSTGTIQYTHSTRTLVFSGAPTLPTDAQYYRVIINNDICKIASRTDGTTLVLDESLNPLADVAAGTSYTLYRNAYPLPGDFRCLADPMPKFLWSAGAYCSQVDFARFERKILTSGLPFRWTVMPDSELQSGFVLKVWGYPSVAESLDVMYRRWPRAIKRSGHESTSRTGTVTCSASTAVSSSGAAFTADMVGSVVRFSSDTAQYPEGMGGMNPFSEQRIITARTSNTLTLKTATENSYSATKFTISDPLDLPRHMVVAYLACCEYWLARLRGNKDWTNKMTLFQAEIRRALEQDQLAPLADRTVQVFDPYSYNEPSGADVGG